MPLTPMQKAIVDAIIIFQLEDFDKYPDKPKALTALNLLLKDELSLSEQDFIDGCIATEAETNQKLNLSDSRIEIREILLNSNSPKLLKLVHQDKQGKYDNNYPLITAQDVKDYIGETITDRKSALEKSGVVPAEIPASTAENFDLLVPTIRAMIGDPSQYPAMIKEITAKKLDFKLFIPVIAKVIEGPGYEYQHENIVEAIPAEKLALFVPALAKAMLRDIPLCAAVIKKIPDQELNSFMPAIGDAMKSVSGSLDYMIRAIPPEKLDGVMPAIGEAMKAGINPSNWLSIIEAIPAKKFDLFVPAIGEAMKADINRSTWPSIIKAIPEGNFDLFVPAIGAAMKADPSQCPAIIKAIPAGKFDLFMPAIGEAMKADPSQCPAIIRAIPAGKFDFFVPAIGEAMKADPSQCPAIIRAIPAGKFDLLVPTIRAMIDDPSQCPAIIKAIPAGKFDLFVPAIAGAMQGEANMALMLHAIPEAKRGGFIEGNIEIVAKAMIEQRTIIKDDLAGDKLGLIVAHLANQSKAKDGKSDRAEGWGLVESIIGEISEDKDRLDVVSKALPLMQHDDQKDGLKKMLTLEQQSLLAGQEKPKESLSTRVGSWVKKMVSNERPSKGGHLQH